MVILGAGGAGGDTLGIVRDLDADPSFPNYKILGFLDNDESKWGTEKFGVEVQGPVSEASEYPNHVRFVNTIGGPFYYWQLSEIIGEAGVPDDRFETLIHPDAYVAERAELGAGVVVYPGSVIHQNVEIGDHVMVKDARLAHDNVIGSYTGIQAGTATAGEVEIKDSCYLGINCSIRGSSHVGKYALVGMGSTVVEDVPKDKVVAGTPAEVIRDARDASSRYDDL